MLEQITLRQLRYFLALAETGHYRKAAERSGISQPSLSQQIVNLEAALGLDLVERGRRGAVLTPGGRDVLNLARKVLEDIDVMHGLAQSAREGIGGTIRLGSTPTLGPYFLPYLTRRLSQIYPTLKVVIRDAAPYVLEEELIAGTHDVILTQLPVQSTDLQVERLFREPLKLAVGSEHALAGRNAVSDADLEGEEILTLSRAFVLHAQITSLCEELGAHVRQDYEGTSLDALRQMTALNMGPSFLPALYVNSEVTSERGDVTILSFRNNLFTRSIGLAWRKRAAHRQALARVAAVAREVALERFKGLIFVE